MAAFPAASRGAEDLLREIEDPTVEVEIQEVFK